MHTCLRIDQDLKQRMKKCLKLIAMALFMVVYIWCHESPAEMITQQILKKADEARGNLSGVEWKLLITSEGGQDADKMIFDVKARGFDILAESLYPAKDKGNKVLMVNGNMWFYKPGLSRAVPIARRQKLIGNAAYGDIASTNYAEDYSATPMPQETVNSEQCYVFDLKAKTSNATYDRVKYWISVERLVGIKAQYYTVSGKRFKSATMEYENRVEIDGKKRPFVSKMKIEDEIIKDKVTLLDFTETKIGPIPNYVFNINLLKK